MTARTNLTTSYHNNAVRPGDTAKALASFKACKTVCIKGITVKAGSVSHRALLAQA